MTRVLEIAGIVMAVLAWTALAMLVGVAVGLGS